MHLSPAQKAQLADTPNNLLQDLLRNPKLKARFEADPLGVLAENRALPEWHGLL